MNKTEPEPNLVDGIVDTQPEVFEIAVLSATLRDSDFYEMTLGVLCTSKTTGKWEDEFQNPLHNALYKMQQLYYLHMLETGASQVISEPMARSILTQIARGADLIAEDEIDEALGLLRLILEFDPVEALHTAKLGYERWLTKKRAARVITQTTAREDWSLAVTMDAVRVETEAITTLRKDTVYAFGHGIRNRTLDIERVPLGLGKLDKLLGGGVGRKEGVLFIAGQGAGKTIAAVQFACSLALQDKKTLLITTEQPHEELEVRAVSNFCHIPFDRIKDKFDLATLAKPDLEKYLAFENKIKNNLHTADWLDDNSISITEDLDKEVRKLIKKWGYLDAIILDWIGGALGSTKAADPAAIRHIYQNAGDSFCATMNRHNLIGIAFAQGHPTLAANKMRVDASTLSECKSMGRKFTNGIGITALLEPTEDETVGSDNLFQATQFFYLFKGRKSTGGCAPFRRDYGFQRMGNTY